MVDELLSAVTTEDTVINSTIPLCQPSATSLHSDNSSSIMCHSSTASLQSNETSNGHPSTMSFCHSSTDDICDASAVDLCYSPDIPSPPTQMKKHKKKSVSVSVRVKGKNKGKTFSYDNCIICNHCVYVFDRNTDYQHSKKCWHTMRLIRCPTSARASSGHIIE